MIYTFCGAPGAGKGTLAEQCVAHLGYTVLSTGNLCRKHIADQTELGKQIQSYTHAGKLIPDEMVTQMVEEWLVEQVNDAPSVILDGFPRTARQVDLFVALLKNKFSDQDFKIICVDLPDEEIVKRIAGRLVCENKQCQAVYSDVMLTKLVCKKCQSALVRRKDDQPDVVRERLRIHARHADELMDAYKEHGIDVDCLKVSGLSIDEVFSLFKRIVGVEQK